MHIVGRGWGIDGVFWMCVAFSAFMLLMHMTFFTKRVEETERFVVEAPTTDEGESVDSPNYVPVWRRRLRELPFLDARFMLFIFVLLPVRTLFAHQFLTLPDYVFRAFPKAVSDRFEWIMGINPLIIVIFVPTIAAFTRKVRVIDMMIAGTTLSALTTFILVPGPNLNALLFYVVMFSFGEAMWSSRFLEYVADLAPVGKVGAYMGLAGIPWFLAKFTTGLYSGFMLNRFIPEHGPQDTSTLWLIYACIACISPIGLILMRRWVIAGEKK